MARTSAAPPAAPAPEQERPHYTHRQILKILAGLMMAMLTSMVSTSVVGTALPTIVGDLGGQDQLAWVASAALLTMTASTPLWGKLSDLFGRKLMFQSALFIFVAASMAAGLSQDIGQLITARAFQGLGVGGLSALAQVIIGDVVEPRQRGRYAGFMGAVFGVSTVAGPLIGGFIVDAEGLGWRWCFYVCVPLAVVASIVIQKVLKLPRIKRDTSLDVLGAVTITGSATVVMLLLSLGGKEFAWNSPWTYGMAAGAVLLVALSIAAERRAREPILPPRLFRNPTFLLTAVASLCVGIAMFGVMIYLPQFLQIVHGMSPTGSGLMTLPLVLAMFVTSTGSGQIVTRTGRWKLFPVVGLSCVAVALFLLSRLDTHSSRLVIGADVAVLGFGMGLTLQILILAAQNAARDGDLASTTSGVSFFRNLGGAMGVAAFGAILSNRLAAEMSDELAARGLRPPAGDSEVLGSPDQIHALPQPFQGIVLESFSKALETVFLVAAPVAVLGLIAVLALKELPLRGAAGRRAEGDDGPDPAPDADTAAVPAARPVGNARDELVTVGAAARNGNGNGNGTAPVPRTSRAAPLPSGARVRGTVRDGDGAPVRDARVTLVDAAGNVVAMMITGPDGEYAFSDLPGGRYTVTAAGYPPVASAVSATGGGHDEHDLELGHPDE